MIISCNHVTVIKNSHTYIQCIRSHLLPHCNALGPICDVVTILYCTVLPVCLGSQYSEKQMTQSDHCMPCFHDLPCKNIIYQAAKIHIPHHTSSPAFQFLNLLQLDYVFHHIHVSSFKHIPVLQHRLVPPLIPHKCESVSQ